ncbi:MAG: hypothetical protein A2V88_00170 [Elusimicrobia bacterium RBG_16_66_12]|nr:MAG: hypothetical protein A2V88_00170 [Elusimicrobia bacterium RBG_16_66_12]
MQMLNRYFTPFALALIVMAVYFRADEFNTAGLHTPMIAVSILFADVAVNWWVGRNQYRWAAWAPRFRQIQVWLNYLWASVLFYLLFPYWSPMWLLLVVAPTAAALTTSRLETVLCALASAGTMILIYWERQSRSLSPEFLGMALSQALFIIIFALFVHGLAQNALRMRDHNLS